MSINITYYSCIKCGKCAQVCPAGIMIQDQGDQSIRLQHPNNCIACGHCVDVCPTNSVQHHLFPAAKQHSINPNHLPSPEQVMLLIKSRRSNRALTSKPIPTETLNQLMEAARYAPTASNKQEVSCTIISDAQTLQQISDFTINTFSSTTDKLSNPLIKWALKPFLKNVYSLIPRIKLLKQMHIAGNDPILRKATSLLIFHSPKSNKFGCVDSNLAYQNASLMAQSLGISQIYMGFILKATKMDKKRQLNKLLGIDGTIHAIMAIGIPAFSYSKYTDR